SVGGRHGRRRLRAVSRGARGPLLGARGARRVGWAVARLSARAPRSGGRLGNRGAGCSSRARDGGGRGQPARAASRRRGGGGVVGTAIARELSRFELRCTLVEAAADVGAGTSKANTALLHTGFDAEPGTLEAKLVPRGRELLNEYAGQVGIPLELTGALLVAW